MILRIQTGLILTLLSCPQISGMNCNARSLDIPEPVVTELLNNAQSYFSLLAPQENKIIKELVWDYVVVSLELERTLSDTVSSLLTSSKSFTLKKKLLDTYHKQGYDPNVAQGPHGLSPLISMVLAEEKDAVTLLCSIGANPNQTSGYGYSALHEAAHIGNVSLAEPLIEAKAVVNQPKLLADGDRVTPLSLAITEGHLPMVLLLLQHDAQPNYELNASGETPFTYAVRKGNAGIIQALVSTETTYINKKVVNQEDGSIETPLRIAVTRGDLATVTLLLNSNADPNCVLNVCGETALICAVRRGFTAIAELLLKAGATQPIFFMGQTPLLLAFEAKNQELVQLLIDYGAANAGNSTATPLYIAAMQGDLPLAMLLVENGADLNGTTADGETALFAATQRGYLGIVQLLLSAGARTDKAESSGKTPLSEAVRLGSEYLVHLLLEKNTPTETATKDGFTPLLLAARDGRTEILKLLLAAHANARATTRKGTTALDLARAGNHTDIVNLLAPAANPKPVVRSAQQPTLQDMLQSMRWKGNSQQQATRKATERRALQLVPPLSAAPLKSSTPQEAQSVNHKRKPLAVSPVESSPVRVTGSEKRNVAQAGLRINEVKAAKR